ncbi:MAG TPA: hypothetical protein VGQ83_10065 [Polyangia bacterium]
MRTLVLAFSLLLAGTAAAQQSPSPAAGAQDTAPGVDYPVPPSAPRGGVRVMSYGVTDVRPDRGGTSTRALQVRLLVSNEADDTPWTLDTRQVLAAVAGQGQSRAAFVNTDGGTPPVLRIARGKHVTVDLYYPLPDAVANAGSAPGFQLAWQVRTSAGVFAENTPFNPAGADSGYAEEQPQAPPPASPPADDSGGDDSGGYDYGNGGDYDNGGGGYAYAPPVTSTWVAPTFGFSIGLGPVWWCDPLYPSFTFYSRPLILAGGYWPYHRLAFVGPYRSFYGPYVYRPFYGRFGFRPYYSAWGFRRPFYGGYGSRPYGGYGYRGYGGRYAGPGYRGGYVGRPGYGGYVGRPGYGGGVHGRPVSPAYRGGFVGRPAYGGGFAGRPASPAFRAGGPAPAYGGMRGGGFHGAPAGGGFRGAPAGGAFHGGGVHVGGGGVHGAPVGGGFHGGGVHVGGGGHGGGRR